MLLIKSFHKSNQSCNLSINREFIIDLNGEKSENIFHLPMDSDDRMSVQKENK